MAAKILLVEDDKSLREIYGVRLMAEGYDIVSASDGEQALAIAIKERPMLIITDVMMPKISGFDMLDILRSTSETKDIKVIMMTALSSDDQRMRGERMGADRYLVKSQVGIEDVVHTVHEVLGDATAAKPVAPAPTATAAAPLAPMTPAPIVPAAPAAAPNMPAAPMAPAPAAPVMPMPAAPPHTPVPMPAPTAPAPITPAPVDPTTPMPSSSKQRIIHPINDITAKVNINELLDRELAKEAGLDMLSTPQVASTQQERSDMQDQIKATVQAPVTPAPVSPPVIAPPSAPPPSLAQAPRSAPQTPSAPTRPGVAPLQTPPRPTTVQ